MTYSSVLFSITALHAVCLCQSVIAISVSNSSRERLTLLHVIYGCVNFVVSSLVA